MQTTRTLALSTTVSIRTTREAQKRLWSPSRRIGVSRAKSSFSKEVLSRQPLPPRLTHETLDQETPALALFHH